ncbi:MAG: DMT family transporter [Proteobacteria bacterium]|nr:DMT family transporter [Pseudomonadota bacterium]
MASDATTADTVSPPRALFDTRQALLLAALTITWGLNWPVMKAGIGDFPPLSFRTLSMWLGTPLLWLALRRRGVPLAIARRDWPALAGLTLTNMLFWHVVAINALAVLSSGRAAILGYTMPIFAAVWGVVRYGDRLQTRHAAGVAAAAIGVALLLWHEFARIAGRPIGAIGMLVAAAVWAIGTQQLRRSRLNAPILAVVFWMTCLTTLAMTLLACLFEQPRWHAPGTVTWLAAIYNAVLIFAFANPLWLVMARRLPPMASSLSIMLIPVLGTVSGAWWLGERLHWQDGAAIALMMVAIGSVLWPSKAAATRQRA